MCGYPLTIDLQIIFIPINPPTLGKTPKIQNLPHKYVRFVVDFWFKIFT